MNVPAHHGEQRKEALPRWLTDTTIAIDNGMAGHAYQCVRNVASKIHWQQDMVVTCRSACHDAALHATAKMRNNSAKWQIAVS